VTQQTIDKRFMVRWFPQTSLQLTEVGPVGFKPSVDALTICLAFGQELSAGSCWKRTYRFPIQIVFL